jgi:membrane protein implicated in regulation of membrane protease activity
MAPHRDLIVANLAGLLVLLVALLIGWWEAAAFGLAVLAILDLMVLLRRRQMRTDEVQTGEDESANANREGST